MPRRRPARARSSGTGARSAPGLAFTLPLFLVSMARDFGLVGAWAHAPWVNWAFLVLATPVQFYVGWSYYTGSFKALRNRGANMDVLVALGSSAAFFYSVVVTVALTVGVTTAGEHVYFETAAAIITLIKLGKWLEVRARGETGDAIRRMMALRPAHRHPPRGWGGAGGAARPGTGGPGRAGASRRADSGRRRRARRALLGGREHLHRREPPGGQGAGGGGDRRHPQPRGAAAGARDPGGRRHRPGGDRAPGARGPGQQGARAAAGRPGGGDLRADRDRDRGGDLPGVVDGRGRRSAGRVDPHGGGAGDRLPVRPGVGDPPRP